MNRLAGRFGDRTRAGSRGRRLECPLARFVLRSRSRPLWRMRLRLQQEGEISHLLLQNADLSLQGGKLFGQRQQLNRQRWYLAGNRGGRHLGKGSQAALMQAGQHLEVLLAHPFFAAIAGITLKRKLRIRQPAA